MLLLEIEVKDENIVTRAYSHDQSTRQLSAIVTGNII